MNWRQDLDSLIESTMGFAKDVVRQPPPGLPVATRAAEQALAETPVPAPATSASIVRSSPERDEIRKRVTSFKTHQEKMAREREEYYLQVKARMLATRKSPPA